MRKGLLVWLLLGMLLALSWPVKVRAAQGVPRAVTALSGRIPSAPAYDPYVAALLPQVRAERLETFIAELSGEHAATIEGQPQTITTRYTYNTTGIAQATQYVYERMQALGYAVSYHTYTYNGYALRNVVAEKRGVTRPAEVFLLTAHVDGRATWPHNPAPAADDNASGTAALLAIAEVLAPLSFEATLRFVFFTGEEQGKRGSYAYVNDAFRAHAPIAGVYNVDMIAWDSTGNPDFDIHTLSTTTPNDSQALADLLVHVIGLYALPLNPQVYRSGIDFSDHYYFWIYGYPAVLVIEDYYNAAGGPNPPRDWNPNYHTKNDRLSTLNLSFAEAIARAVMAATLHLVRPLRTLQGTVRAPDGKPLAASLRLSGAPGTWQTTTTNGRYTFTAPADVYTLEVSATHYLTHTLSVNLIEVSPQMLDVTLEPWPSYPVYGTLRDAVNALPLVGTLEVDGGAPQPIEAHFALSLPRGAHTLTVRAPYHLPQTQLLQVTRSQAVDFALTPTPCLLLVDDDGGSSVETAWAQALSALGYNYGVWTVAAGSDGPSADMLNLYRGVVWVTGSASAPLRAADLAALRMYLTDGGRLLLSGTTLPDGAWDAALFHAQFAGSESGPQQAVIGNTFLNGLTLGLSDPAPPQRLVPDGEAQTIARYASGHVAAVGYQGPQGSSLVLGFGLETGIPLETRTQMLDLMLAYLALCPAYAAEVLVPPVAFGTPGTPARTTLTVVNRGFQSNRYEAWIESGTWAAELSTLASPLLNEHEAWRSAVQVTLPPVSQPGDSTPITLTVRSQITPSQVYTRTVTIVHARQCYLPILIRP